MNKKKIRNEILIIGMWENRQTETNRQMDRQTKQKEIQTITQINEWINE